MGKKSKNKNKNNKKPKGDRANGAPVACPVGTTSSAYSEAVLPLLSIDEVQTLPQVSNHIWKVVVCEDTPMVIGVVDMTNQAFGGAQNPRDMIVRRVEISKGHAQTVNIILNGMKDPPGRPGSDDPAFYRPRRPRFLLVDPKLEPIFPGMKDQIESLGIPVRLYSELSYTEAALTIEQSGRQHRSSYSEGLQSVTAVTVRHLPQNPDETWSVFVYTHEMSPTGMLLVVENHGMGEEEEKTLVGNGATNLVTIGQGILAVMLSPVLGPVGGAGGDAVYDTPRRPGKIVLNGTLEQSSSHIREVLLGSGVEVL